MTSKDEINRNRWLFALAKFRISISECKLVHLYAGFYSVLSFFLVVTQDMSGDTTWQIEANFKLFLNTNMFVFLCSYCKVPVQKLLLSDLLPGPVTLVFQRSEALNTDLNPFTSVWVLSTIRQLEKNIQIKL